MKTNDVLEEGLRDHAHAMEQEHYLQTVRARAYHLAKESIALYHLLKSVGNEEPARLGSMATALTNAQNLVASVKSDIEFEGVVPSIHETVSAGATGAASVGVVAKPIGSKKKAPLIRR